MKFLKTPDNLKHILTLILLCLATGIAISFSLLFVLFLLYFIAVFVPYGLALILATGVSSIIGLFFWIVVVDQKIEPFYSWLDILNGWISRKKN